MTSFTLVTWNVNSVRRRLDQLERVAEATDADVICLQETKCADEHFPNEVLKPYGYHHHAVAGQRSYNGVAILSKIPLSNIQRHHHCGVKDARHISADVTPPGFAQHLTIHSIYVPAGGQIPDPDLNPKFAHKLRFVDTLSDHFTVQHGLRDAAIVAGDFNIAPLPADVWNHARMTRTVTHTDIEIAALERLKRALYFIDVVREVVPGDDPVFTWWSYRAADWQAANRGRRLDHIWVTPVLKDHIAGIDVLTDVRHWTPPSDHVPVVLKLKASTA